MNCTDAQGGTAHPILRTEEEGAAPQRREAANKPDGVLPGPKTERHFSASAPFFSTEQHMPLPAGSDPIGDTLRLLGEMLQVQRCRLDANPENGQDGWEWLCEKTCGVGMPASFLDMPVIAAGSHWGHLTVCAVAGRRWEWEDLRLVRGAAAALGRLLVER